jgi:hypothetical protein
MMLPASENDLETSEFAKVDYHDLSDNESCLGSAYVSVDKLEGLEALEELLEVIRHILAGKQTAKTFIYLRDLFEKLDQNFYACILREFIHCTNIVEQAMKIQKHIFLRSVLSKVFDANTVSELLIHCSTQADARMILETAFVLCRLLPPHFQKDFLRKSGQLYLIADRIVSKESNHVLPKIEYFFQFIFDFNKAPVSYCLSAQIEKEHESAFMETMWYLIPLILESTILSIESIDSVRKCLELTWINLKHKKSWIAFLRAVVSRVCKRNGSRYGSTTTNKKCLILFDWLIERKDCDNRMLCFTVYMMFIERVNKTNLQRVLKICLSAFKDHSEEVKKIQEVLSRVLDNVDSDFWTDESLGLLRLIDRNKCKGCKDILFACYSKLKYSEYKDLYFPDIARGLRNNAKKWIDILSYFLSKENTSIIRRVYSAYYPILKDLLGTETRIHGTVFTTFCEILKLSGRNVSATDWKILGKYCDLISTEDIESLLNSPELPLSEASIEKLTLRLFADGFFRASSLTRLFGKSSQPTALGWKIAKACLNVKYDLNQAQWFALLHVAEVTKSDEIHENLCDILHKSRDFAETDIIDLCALKLCLLVVEREKSIKKHSKVIQHLIECDFYDSLDYFQATNFYQASILLAAGGDPKSKNLFVSSEESCFQSAAYWRHLHKTEPRKVKIAEFKKSFISIVDYIFGNFTFRNEITTSSFVLIDLIQEFEDETYFDELRKYAIKLCLDDPERSHVFAPRYLLAEAVHCVKEKAPISKKIRSFLFDVKRWFREYTSPSLLVQTEWLEILIGVQKFAMKSSFDSESVVFAATFYFVDTYNESKAEIFKEVILTQLAK